MHEFKINKYLFLRMYFNDGITRIYVSSEPFMQCKFLLLNINAEEINTFEEIKSIDEVAEMLDASMEDSYKFRIPPENSRVLEGGKITHIIKVENDAYACMLGGPDRRTLFVATSTHTRTNGRIEYVEVDTPGAGLP